MSEKTSDLYNFTTDHIHTSHTYLGRSAGQTNDTGTGVLIFYDIPKTKILYSTFSGEVL